LYNLRIVKTESSYSRSRAISDSDDIQQMLATLQFRVLHLSLPYPKTQSLKNIQKSQFYMLFYVGVRLGLWL